MIAPSLQTAALLLCLTVAAQAQVPAPKPPKAPPKPVLPYVNHNLIFLDPAHGGTDAGAHLANNVLEKDITLALASQIRTLLAGNGLSVLLAREADTPAAPADPDADTPATPPALITPDQRAGTANHAHPVACILLHATGSGNGVHIVTSSLPAPDTSLDLLPTPARAIPWESAQADSVLQSNRLASEIGTALSRANLPIHLSHASVKPIDSLMCPAVAIEIAPLASGPTQVSDNAYQQRVAQAVAQALLFWRGHADPPLPVTPPSTAPRSTGAQP